MTRKPSGPSRPLFSGKRKLSDLIDLNPDLLAILGRTGIGPGFGEATVEEACLGRGLDTDTFLEVCRVYTFRDYVPSAAALEKVRSSDIIRYLKLSHNYYVSTALTSLREAINKMLISCDEKRKRVIFRFFEEYEKEMLKHFEYEEELVFPYVGALSSKASDIVVPPMEREFEHSSMGEKINDLKNIVLKYLPAGSDSDTALEVLRRLYDLSSDIARHTSIEDNILLPIIKRMESHGE